MQTAALGWSIDDVIAVSRSADKLAISCKSNTQVTGTGLPNSFVLSSWQQWKNAQPGGSFNRAKDKLMLATRGKHQTFEPLWADIKSWTSHPDNPLALARSKQTAAHAKIFDNAKAAIQTVDPTVSDQDVIALLSTLEVLSTDFDLPNSENRAAAISQCRRLLVSGEQAEAVQLWVALVDEAEAARTTHGIIKLDLLWSKLTKTFILKGHINFERPWTALDAITSDVRAQVQTTLPTGTSLERQAGTDALVDRLSIGSIVVVYGESGTGKSALVKSTLDQRYPTWKQVWLRLDDLETLLSPLKRQSVGFNGPLADVLRYSPSSENVLVLDAAERFPDELAAQAQSLVGTLIEHNKLSLSSWRVIIVGQVDAWSRGKLQRISNSTLPLYYDVRLLAADEVRQGLLSAPQLKWAVAHDEIVYTLTNLRTLAWVLQAATQFENGDASSLTSHITIADQLWRYWTDDRVVLQRTLMVLATREANFEHSFEVSKLEPGDAQAIDSKPPQLPLRRNRYNRIEFEHDLASDWARFQSLKSIAMDTEQWAALASNPLWLGALRMLGGFLLRERAPDGRSAWDVAFESVASNSGNASAADVLLDALCLDPNAEVFLTERIDLLLGGHGRQLNRLLRRFLHVATVPGGQSKLLADVLYAEPSFSLYLEAQFRTPIPGRWGGLARFLSAHQAAIAGLCASVVGSVCERWLSAFPAEYGGSPFPLRKQFAELAVATARAVQLEQRKNTIFADESVKQIFSAAFAAAPDLPDKVSEWALEMAQRRPLDAYLAAAVAEHRKREAAEHQERLLTDEQYRARHEQKQSFPTYIPSGRKLPPWPMGPRRRLDTHFRNTCAHGAALLPLMRVRPAAAAELLLAVIVESAPEEEYGTSRFKENAGLEYDSLSYPTGYWKSPFFSFFQIDRDVALETFVKLVNFCTDRWINEVKRHSEGRYPSIKLRMNDGSEKEYFGNSRVYDWCLSNASSAGQLNSGLAALERWLSLLVEAGEDITPLAEKLIQGTQSVAVLAVLVNAGKLKPDLFLNVLRPLASNKALHLFDENLVEDLHVHFAGMQFAPLGEIAFNIARDWHFAAHHRVTMTSIIVELIGTNDSFAKSLGEVAATWTATGDEKAALEQRILQARLDSANYVVAAAGADGEKKREFRCPTDLAADIIAFQQSKVAPQTVLALPDHCLGILGRTEPLDSDKAQQLAACLPIIDNESSLEDDFKSRARIAVASTLAAKARDWLSEHADIKQEVSEIVRRELASIAETAEEARRAKYDLHDNLTFLTYAVFYNWLESPSIETDAAVMKLMTSGNSGAEKLLFSLAYLQRRRIGERWPRLVDLGLLWAGLSILRPGYGDEDATPVWDAWLRRFRGWRIEGASPSLERIDAANIANRVERLERARWRRSHSKPGWRRDFPPDDRRSNGLDWSFLENAFYWLSLSDRENGSPTGTAAELAEERRLLLSLWSFEVWLRHRSDDELDDDPGPTQLGYNLLSHLAKRISREPIESAIDLWEPVLRLGAPAHHAIGTFFQYWFDEAATADAEEFVARWGRMIEYALSSPTWGNGNPWFYGQRILTQVLGCNATSTLNANPAFQTLVFELKSLYDAWAVAHLRRDDDNITAICAFLSSSTGKRLRLGGLEWIHSALVGEHPVYIASRSSALDSLVNLLDAMLTEDISLLAGSPAARSTYLTLIDILVARQVAAALALQERARRLLRADRT
ncbi:hypothetical protein AAFG07_29945 [Bradyrhizobium sp. B097]|uniref:hypothetical protein n=1 Tax=Bradyrhizobium sp. B097 TaxID=3140244 RepID=UPI0031841DDA